MPTGGASFPNSGLFDDVNTSIWPEVWNAGETFDIITKDLPWLYFLRFGGPMKEKVLSRDTVFNVLFNQATGGGTFSGYQVLQSATWDGSRAASFQRAHHYVPLQTSLTEELDLTSPTMVKDNLMEKREMAHRNLENILASAFIVGNAANPDDVIGLEQCVPGVTHVQADGTTNIQTDANPTDFKLQEWQLRQGTQAFGGLTRTAWTAASQGIGGTGDYWTPASIDFHLLNTNLMRSFGYNDGGATSALGSGNYPTPGLQALSSLIMALTRGADGADAIVSTYMPYVDFKHGAAGRVQIQQGPSYDGKFAFPHEHFVWEGKLWWWDRNLTTKQVLGNETLGSENVYVINSKHMDWIVDPRLAFALTRPQGPHDQMANVLYVLLRHLVLYKNPGAFGRIFDYPVAA